METNNLPAIKQRSFGQSGNQSPDDSVVVIDLSSTELNNECEYISKDSQRLKELETGIYNLIEISNVPDIIKTKGANMGHSRYFVKLNARTFKPRHLLGILRAIIEHSNYEMVKNRNQGI